MHANISTGLHRDVVGHFWTQYRHPKYSQNAVRLNNDRSIRLPVGRPVRKQLHPKSVTRTNKQSHNVNIAERQHSHGGNDQALKRARGCKKRRQTSDSLTAKRSKTWIPVLQRRISLSRIFSRRTRDAKPLKGTNRKQKSFKELQKPV